MTDAVREELRAKALEECEKGIAFYRAGKLDEAVNALTRSLAIDPKGARAHLYLGKAAAKKGWKEAAEKELETARKLDPAIDGSED